MAAYERMALLVCDDMVYNPPPAHPTTGIQNWSRVASVVMKFLRVVWYSGGDAATRPPDHAPPEQLSSPGKQLAAPLRPLEGQSCPGLWAGQGCDDGAYTSAQSCAV